MAQAEKSSFYKLFSWEMSFIAVPGLYVLGWAFLAACSFIEPQFSFFYLAGACFTVALLWSLAALYTHDSLVKPRIRYPRNRTPPSGDLPRKRRRRRNKKARKIVGVLTALLYIGCVYKVVTGYRAFAHPPRPDNFEVFVRSTFKTRAMRVEPKEDPESSIAMTFALSNIPIVDLEVGNKQTMVRLTVLIRNIQKDEVHNVRVRIDTDGSVQPAEPSLARISPTELVTTVPTVTPYRDGSGEVVVPIDVEIPSFRGNAGLLITLDSEDTHSYAAAVRVEMSRASKPDQDAQKQ